MSSFGNVGGVGGLSLPQIPIERFWNFILFKGAALNIFAKNNIDVCKFPEAASSNQFDGLTET